MRNESLWDTEYNPLDPNNAWATATDSPPSSNVRRGFGLGLGQLFNITLLK